MPDINLLCDEHDEIINAIESGDLEKLLARINVGKNFIKLMAAIHAIQFIHCFFRNKYSCYGQVLLKMSEG